MRYLPVGTDEGIRMLNQGNGDFGAGEVPLEKERNGSKLRVVPTILIGIVPIYNLPGRSVELRFTGDLLAQIFLGRVKTWNSPAIAKLNQGISLPDLPIKVIYRPGGKGSNYVFTEFLSRSNPQFRSAIGISPSPNWPVGTAAERSADMVKGVKDNLGSIGYVELQYAIQLRVAYGLVQNPSGQFVRASDKTIAAAWEAVASLNPESFNASLTDAPGPNSYPITSFSWIYIPVDLGNQAHAAAMTDLLNWVFTEGQTIAAQLGYSPLPSRLLQKVQAKVKVLH